MLRMIQPLYYTISGNGMKKKTRKTFPTPSGFLISYTVLYKFSFQKFQTVEIWQLAVNSHAGFLSPSIPPVHYYKPDLRAGVYPVTTFL